MQVSTMLRIEWDADRNFTQQMKEKHPDQAYECKLCGKNYFLLMAHLNLGSHQYLKLNVIFVKNNSNSQDRKPSLSTLSYENRKSLQ